NQYRADFQRENFLRHWHAAKVRGRAPRMFMKYGANHMQRGLDATEVFDLGTLVPELAAAEGGHAFQLMVLGGKGAIQGQLNAAMQTVPAPAEAIAGEGLALFDEAAG